MMIEVLKYFKEMGPSFIDINDSTSNHLQINFNELLWPKNNFVPNMVMSPQKRNIQFITTLELEAIPACAPLV